jgi:hypothetical protein
MARDVREIVAEFRRFTAEDFDYMKGAPGPERLYALCEEVSALPDPTVVFPEFFALMERLPDCELGTPGPLVHTMEQRVGSYEILLVDSVKRKPTDLGVWMVNRILNGPAKDKAFWMDVLAFAGEHPAASQVVRDGARRFIDFQKKK